MSNKASGAIGATGYTGAIGSIGAIGATGSIGPIGPIGAIGGGGWPVGGGGATGAAGDWVCPSCTVINPAGATQCKICTRPRGPSPRRGGATGGGATSKGNTSGQNESNSRPPLLRYAAAGNLNRSPAQRRVLASRMFSPQKSALKSALSSAEIEYLVEGSSNQGINYNAKIAKADAEGFPDVAAFWMKKQEEEKSSTQNINAFLAAYEEGGYRRKGRRGSRTRRNKRSRRAKTRRAKTRR